MFVVFEGIDGSGKTTVSNKVAKLLRRRGLEIEHVREGGEFASPLVTRLREFGKDPRNMAMAPLTELLFYVTRDAQLLAECIQPALKRGGLVFADRYLYSYEVLSHFGRGVPIPQIRPILDAVADGTWPDLVVLMDVDPFLARARRKIGKLLKKAKDGIADPSSRKSLQGTGTQHRLREGYLKLAAREPERWLVVDNSDPLDPESQLDAIVERIANAIERMWRGERASAVISDAQVPATPAIAAARPDFESGRDAFYRAVEARATRELPVAAYFLGGLEDERAQDLREQWARKAPDIIAYGMAGLADERSWQLRDLIASRAPYYVVLSLEHLPAEDARAEEMRQRFAPTQPSAVLATLDGIDSAAAWAIRDHLADEYLPEVVASLKRMDSERAWSLRARFAAETSEPMKMGFLVDSIRGLGDDRAWAIRDRYLDVLPVEVLWSLDGVQDARSWGLRSRYASQAPKIVLRTIDGIDEPRAWALRRVYAPRVKEALDSMTGLDGDVAWAIRSECLDIWPSTTVKSLGTLVYTARGREMSQTALGRYPENVSLLKHVARLAELEVKSQPGLEKVG